MSYTHTHLPEINDLKKNIETNPDVVRYYAKYEGFVGSEESINYLTKKIDEYYKRKSISKRV
jgi:hypothetical protein